MARSDRSKFPAGWSGNVVCTTNSYWPLFHFIVVVGNKIKIIENDIKKTRAMCNNHSPKELTIKQTEQRAMATMLPLVMDSAAVLLLLAAGL